MDSVTPILNGSISLITGNFLGAVGDRVVHTLNMRRQMIEKKAIHNDISLLDTFVDIFFHVGILSFSTHMVSKALPYITEDPASFTLFLMGILSTSPNLSKNLKKANDILFNIGEEVVPIPRSD